MYDDEKKLYNSTKMANFASRIVRIAQHKRHSDKIQSHFATQLNK